MQDNGDGNERRRITQTEAVMETKLKGLPGPTSVRTYSIYRVPKLLRETNEEAYTPALFPIGPYHHHHSQSVEADQTVEALKLNYLRSFLGNSGVPLVEYIKILNRHKGTIQLCYGPCPTWIDHDNENGNDEFIEMVLTDSAFLIQLFRKGIQPEADEDMIWDNPRLKYEVLRDIMLLENQLPLFVLRDLLTLQGIDGLDVLVNEFLRHNYGFTLDSQLINPVDNKIHLLALVRHHYVRFLHNSPITDLNEASHNSTVANGAQPEQKCNCNGLVVQMSQFLPLQNNRPTELFPKATKLVNASVKFQVGESLKFNLNEGTLTLPRLDVRDQTVCLYRNLIAYEQCNHPNDPFFTCYIYFLNGLIDSPEDIQVLVKNGVIKTLWSSEDLYQMLNSLRKNVKTSQSAYMYTAQHDLIKKFYHMKCNHHIGYLCREYSTPWQLISLAGGILIFIATAVQAVFSVLAYFKGK